MGSFAGDAMEAARTRRQMLVTSLAFVLGLALVFIAFGASAPMAARVGILSSVGFKWHAAQCCANSASPFGACARAEKLESEASDNVIKVVRMSPPARQE